MVVLEPGLYANSMILVGSLIFGTLIFGLDVCDCWFKVPQILNGIAVILWSLWCINL